ncbi:MAG: S1/P1 nuclease [Sphingobacteriales bacterium]|nr:S1/P1 nuclease [Sphingobacteriales bacterium]OJY81770.1 MAG: S1/P1 Nuclease [Sphingobacteriales bacterium 44-15]
MTICRRCVFAVIFFVLLVCSQSGFAWGVTGHRVVAEIAQRHLSSRARKALKELIGDQSLAYWANWADFVKSDSTYRYASRWHYVDLPAHLEKDAFVAALKALPGENLFSRIPVLEDQVKDKSLSHDQRQFALKYLIHLIGDAHQPLHVGRDEDQGGNKISVTWFGKPSNLHIVWDELLVDFQQWSYTEYATVLDVADKATVSQLQSGNLADWLYESHILSDRIYDNIKADSKLSYRYNYLFMQDLNDQLLKGGLRLARILNELLG